VIAIKTGRIGLPACEEHPAEITKPRPPLFSFRINPVDLHTVNPLQVEHWDESLLAHPTATIFHTRAWAQVLANTYGYRPEYLVGEEGSQLFALLPLCEVRSWITGVRGVSLPFTDRCDPLASADVAWPELFAAACKLGRERPWKYLEVRGFPEGAAKPSAEFYSHDLDLSSTAETLFEHCGSAMRRSIRKAEGQNLEIQALSTPDAMDAYYRLHLLTRQKHGIPPQPVKFFRNIQRFLVASGLGTVLLALRDKKPVAGAIFLHFGRTSIYKFGASDPARQDLRPNNLLLWRGILHMKQLGAKTLSFGRTSLEQDGLRRFKLGFGAVESPLRYARFNFAGNAFAAPRPDRSTGLHTSLFRYCPSPISRLAGAVIYPHIG
jgi:CelD/BcsL family acetyltransferase involved in cellulose biosynthesis